MAEIMRRMDEIPSSGTAADPSSAVPAPLYECSTTGPTNGNVAVTATVADGYILWYSCGGTGWTVYTGPVVMTENGVVSFRASDGEGNTFSETVSCEVSNIDREPPVRPDIFASTTEPTNGTVTLTAEFSNDSAVRRYSLDGGETWIAYDDETGVAVEDNCTVLFQAADAAGNSCQPVSYTVSNISHDVPEPPRFAFSPGELTSGSVTVTAEPDMPESVIYYRIGTAGDWQVYDAAVVLTENAVVYFYLTNVFGNASEIVSCAVTNIDRTPPDAPSVLVSTALPTNQPVTLTADFHEEDLPGQFYSTDGGASWQAYTGPVVMEENGTVRFRCVDRAGNESPVTAYEVTNIDRIAPDAPIASASHTEPVNHDVIVTAVFSDDSAVREYRIGEDGEWLDWPGGGLSVSENCTVWVRGADEAGNVSEATVVEIANIDREPPDDPVPSVNSTAPTREDVGINVDFSEDTLLREYRLENGDWTAFTGSSVWMTDNGTIWFRASDAAGNRSAEVPFEVTWIDRTPPDAPVVVQDVTTPTNGAVTLSASFSDGEDVENRYSLDDGETWTEYTAPVVLTENGTVIFRSTDMAGNASDTRIEVSNIDLEPPDAPVIGLNAASSSGVAYLSAEFSGDSAVREYSLNPSGPWMVCPDVIAVYFNRTVWFRASDEAGNSTVAEYEVTTVSNLAPEMLSWRNDGSAEQALTLAKSGAPGSIAVSLRSAEADVFATSSGKYSWTVRENGIKTASGSFRAAAGQASAAVRSDCDGAPDLFLASPDGKWGADCYAENCRTGATVRLYGKNRISGIFEGAVTDANILFLTDDACGDALFFEDSLSGLPLSVETPQARLSGIREIRAGAGSDVIDLTGDAFGQDFPDGMIVRGGSGNDVIWGGSGGSLLFGDGGNDRITGGSGGDIITGGSGNDILDGGGADESGEDIFCFGKNWGCDQVFQSAPGNIVLWFAEGDASLWDEENLTYADGLDSVTVSGAGIGRIELRFGDGGGAWTEEFDRLAGLGCFSGASSEKIFETSSGMTVAVL